MAHEWDRSTAGLEKILGQGEWKLLTFQWRGNDHYGLFDMQGSPIVSGSSVWRFNHLEQVAEVCADHLRYAGGEKKSEQYAEGRLERLQLRGQPVDLDILGKHVQGKSINAMELENFKLALERLNVIPPRALYPIAIDPAEEGLSTKYSVITEHGNHHVIYDRGMKSLSYPCVASTLTGHRSLAYQIAKLVLQGHNISIVGNQYGFIERARMLSDEEVEATGVFVSNGLSPLGKLAMAKLVDEGAFAKPKK